MTDYFFLIKPSTNILRISVKIRWISYTTAIKHAFLEIHSSFLNVKVSEVSHCASAVAIWNIWHLLWICEHCYYQSCSWDYHGAGEQRVRDNGKPTPVRLISLIAWMVLQAQLCSGALGRDGTHEVAVICTIKSSCFSSEFRLEMYSADIQSQSRSFMMRGSHWKTHLWTLTH